MAVIRNNEQAAQKAEASRSASVGMCQQWTRTMFSAPSVGDVDLDGDADAVDAWKKEKKRHAGDRNPPRGFPLSWAGGSKGYGHRAVSLGNRRVRSIDVNGPGSVGTVSLDWFEKNWGMKYLGWSETISGILIPLHKNFVLPGSNPKPAPKPTPPKKKPLAQIAREVIDGKWGNGDERKRRLRNAGYDYEDVQKIVNRVLS